MSETVVKINNLVKRYKELIALDNFSLEIKKGEVFGLLGDRTVQVRQRLSTVSCRCFHMIKEVWKYLERRWDLRRII